MMDKIPMTAEGYAALEAHLKHCREDERPRIIEQIAEARGADDLSENVSPRALPRLSWACYASNGSKRYAQLLEGR
jgi:hypothetical protein